MTAPLLAIALCAGLWAAVPARAEAAPSAASIDGVRVEGNHETRADTILREITQRAGEPLDALRLEADLARLYKLNFFDRVDYALESSQDPARATLVVSVKEKQTWMLFPAVTYTSLDGLLLSLNYRKDNLLGTGQSLGANINLARNYYYYLNYANPWFGSGKTTLDSTLFAQRVWNNLAVGANVAMPGLIVERQGFNATVGRPVFGDPIASQWQGALVVKAERTALQDFNQAPLGGSALFASGGNADVQAIAGAKLTFDSRDLNLNPTSGWFNALSAEQFVPGLGASNLTRLKLDLSRYLPLGGGHTLALGTRVGHVFSPTGEAVPVYERFFPVVENAVRGWPENPSPEELARFTLGSSSGDSYALASAEYRFPIAWLLSGALFADSGLFWDQAKDNFSWDRTRSGYGAGLRVNMPALGALRIDYGMKEWDPAGGVLQLAVGHKF
ncbi:MAG TPA: BamA/TamA family outer membrane protein [Pantanalinema sp.]